MICLNLRINGKVKWNHVILIVVVVVVVVGIVIVVGRWEVRIKIISY